MPAKKLPDCERALGVNVHDPVSLAHHDLALVNQQDRRAGVKAFVNQPLQLRSDGRRRLGTQGGRVGRKWQGQRNPQEG